jgi:hypothetical protein
MCLNTASASSACMQNALGCCQPFCDFSKNAPCPNPDQKCLAMVRPHDGDPRGHGRPGHLRHPCMTPLSTAHAHSNHSTRPRPRRADARRLHPPPRPRRQHQLDHRPPTRPPSAPPPTTRSPPPTSTPTNHVWHHRPAHQQRPAPAKPPSSFIIKPDVTQPDARMQRPQAARPGMPHPARNAPSTWRPGRDLIASTSSRDPKGLYEPCTMHGRRLERPRRLRPRHALLGHRRARATASAIGLCRWSIATRLAICVDAWARPSAFCQECAVGLCYPPCDPLLQDCPGTDLCIPFHENFGCVLDASGDEGQINDPCEYDNACDKGLYCLINAAASSACMHDSLGCCQPFCDVSQMSPRARTPTRQVRAMVQPRWTRPLEGLEDLGICKPFHHDPDLYIKTMRPLILTLSLLPACLLRPVPVDSERARPPTHHPAAPRARPTISPPPPRAAHDQHNHRHP